jgi:RecB family exonuclease
MKRSRTIAASLLALGLLAGCAPRNPHPMDMSTAAQGAKTKADHEALAEHYEEAAKDAEAKAAEQQKMLDQYKAHSYLYGKQTYSLQEHCDALISSYQRAAKANRNLAKLHREIAQSAP